MSGIYIHIPFCKTRCAYCDFFSQISMEEKNTYVDALCQELELQKDFLRKEEIRTIYFGGGTPSQMQSSDFQFFFEKIGSLTSLNKLSEITLEANPDDINRAYLDSLKKLPFNRISLGIQSFHDHELKFLNRRHNATTAIQAVKECRENGFQNISIDLMYGLPNQSLADWKENLIQAVALNVEHISAYHLIYEENTPLHHLLTQGKISATEEDLSLRMFSEMIDTLTAAGFEHYEISNFGKKGFHSLHNSSYWDGSHYLGIGASAHSFNGTTRHWNVSSLKKYMNGIFQGTPDVETEIIDEKTAYNDFILTRMRTARGIDLTELTRLFGEERYGYCLKNAQKHIRSGNVLKENNRLKISRKGIFISDGIMSDLME